MPADLEAAFAALKDVFGEFRKHLAVTTDTGSEYTLTAKVPSPFPQHKGQPMFFGSVRLGKTGASFHLMPLYMNPRLDQTISAALRKRRAGKICFQFKSAPSMELLAELQHLTGSGISQWREKKWI